MVGIAGGCSFLGPVFFLDEIEIFFFEGSGILLGTTCGWYGGGIYFEFIFVVGCSIFIGCFLFLGDLLGC